jgi:hypothetical protein
MKSQWTETLRLLLETRKPVLCSAHSEADLDRDLLLLDALVLEEDTLEEEPLEVIQVCLRE